MPFFFFFLLTYVELLHSSTVIKDIDLHLCLTKKFPSQMMNFRYAKICVLLYVFVDDPLIVRTTISVSRLPSTWARTDSQSLAEFTCRDAIGPLEKWVGWKFERKRLCVVHYLKNGKSCTKNVFEFFCLVCEIRVKTLTDDDGARTLGYPTYHSATRWLQCVDVTKGCVASGLAFMLPCPMSRVQSLVGSKKILC